MRFLAGLFLIFLSHDNQEKFQNCFAELKEKEHVSGIHLEVMGNHNENIMFSVDAKIVYNERGGVQQIHCILRDVTESKKAEQRLMENEAKYRELFENMTSGVAVFDAVSQGKDFIIKDFNRAAEKIEKMDRSEVIGHKVTDIFPGVKDMGLFAVLHRVWQTGNSENLPLGLYQNGGELVSWRENFVYKLPSGEVVAVYEDVTEHRKDREEIAHSRAQLEAIFNSISDAIVFTDPERKILRVNPAVKKTDGLFIG